ncbi:mitochondrial import inner membrane translocase subunit Tim21-like [Dysidea avara]|uniref:mitochondrial import inner membrane translocase subunit Tim21-like n=1 Tax=Dysidea avara TaxID=196820 RepID=UPI00331C4AF2
MLGKCYCLTLPVSARNVMYSRIPPARIVSVVKTRLQSASFTSATLVNLTTKPALNAARLFPMRPVISGARLMASDSKQGGSSPTSKDKKSTESGSILVKLLEEEQQQTKAVTVGQRVIQAGKDTSYFLIICVGFGITAMLFYYTFRELFSSNSVQSLFSVALKRIKADGKCKAILGEPISAHGETSGRNRRRFISHQEYIVEGEEYMRMQFYVSGSKQQATAHLDVKKNARGKYVCRFLFLELTGYPGGTIIIEDNR